MLINFTLTMLFLEGEMYQLSHMLTDQKSIMSTMLELSITGDKGTSLASARCKTRETLAM